jgi:hypothetical protein
MILVLFLYLKIQKSLEKKVLGVSLSVIDAKHIVKPQNANFKYFYEPKQNSTEIVDMKWLNDKPKYTINSDALNEPTDYQIEKEKGTFRIITLGDSFTFGENVSTENNWTELLETKLNNAHQCSNVKKYEVINLGMKGYDAAYELERYKVRGKKYNPDLIVWYVTDFYRITEEIHKLYQKYITDDAKEQALANEGVFDGKWERAYEEVLEIYTRKDNEEHQIQQYRALRNYYDKNKPLLIMYSADLSSRNIHDAVSFFSHKLNEKNNHYYVLTPFSNDEFLLDRHLNVRGHLDIANQLLTYLATHKMLPCR